MKWAQICVYPRNTTKYFLIYLNFKLVYSGYERYYFLLSFNNF